MSLSYLFRANISNRSEFQILKQNPRVKKNIKQNIYFAN